MVRATRLIVCAALIYRIASLESRDMDVSQQSLVSHGEVPLKKPASKPPRFKKR